MYYVLQNYEVFYVVNPKMVKFGEFTTYDEAQNFCEYLNKNLLESSKPFINEKREVVRKPQEIYYNTYRPQPQMVYQPQPQPEKIYQHQPQFVYQPSVSSCHNQEPMITPAVYQDCMTQEKRYITNPIQPSGVATYGNITINCNSNLPNDKVSPEIISSAPKATNSTLKMVQPELENTGVVKKESILKKNTKSINHLKDESLSTMPILQNNDVEKDEPIEPVRLDKSSSTQKRYLNRNYVDEDSSNPWVTPKELENFIQKLEQ